MLKRPAVKLLPHVCEFYGSTLKEREMRCPDCADGSHPLKPRAVMAQEQASAGNHDMVRLQWQTGVMPVHSYTYGHRACLESLSFPGATIEELDQKALDPRVKCEVCGHGWMPSTNETTPIVAYNQGHLRVKHTRLEIMVHWDMNKWRGWTTDLGTVDQGYGEPVDLGGALGTLVLFHDRQHDTRTVGYLVVECRA